MHHPDYPPERIAAAVDDGLAMLRFSALMAVKNRLIVAALRDGTSFELEGASEIAREEIRALAEEQRDNARITADALAKARANDDRAPVNELDYHAEDAGALIARGEIYRLTADRLDELSRDEDYVDALVEQARASAWDEVGASVSSRLDRIVSGNEPGYDLNRELRIRYLKEVDLRMLARRQKRRRPAGSNGRPPR